MKILIISDIHSDYEAAESLYHYEMPDFVLDCGDHEKVMNLFGSSPHLYVNGNHEPTNIYCEKGSLSLPHKIPPGQIINLIDKNLVVRVAGLDGNYAPSTKPFSVNENDVDTLKEIPEHGFDILLTHESPLNVSDPQYVGLAGRVIDEIDRIKPKYVFSGHGGGYRELITPGGISSIILEEIVKGYGILDDNLDFEWKKLIFR